MLTIVKVFLNYQENQDPFDLLTKTIYDISNILHFGFLDNQKIIQFTICKNIINGFFVCVSSKDSISNNAA